MQAVSHTAISAACTPGTFQGKPHHNAAATLCMPFRSGQLAQRPSQNRGVVASHNQRAELQLGWPGAETFYESDATTSNHRFDVLGLGQAMVDFQATADSSFLDKLNVEKGTRKIIDAEERTAILQSIDSDSYKIEAGGSLSNTLMCLARLSSAAVGLRRAPRPLRVAMAGLIGSDALGSFYTAQMRSSGVEVLSGPTPGALTGTVAVITTDDAARTMLSYLGTPSPIAVSAELEAAIAASSVLVIEGYLWELDSARDTILAAIAVAKRNGTLVAMTAGDAGVVHRHHEELWETVAAGIDLLFTNAAEAEALAAYLPPAAAIVAPLSEAGAVDDGTSSSGATPAERAALALAPYCSMVCVTDGSNGSVITALGQLHVVPPHWTESPPVDTCGAGDAYAAGLLYGFLMRFDVAGMGRVGARVASSIIARQGARLEEDQAARLAVGLPVAAESMWHSSTAAAVERA